MTHSFPTRRSSDLRRGVAGPSLNTLQEALKRIVQILGKAARAKGLIGAEEAAEALGEGGEGGDGASAGAFNLGGGDAANKAAAIQVGRASCRERGCQYV